MRIIAFVFENESAKKLVISIIIIIIIANTVRCV